jgi:hypothetical protein
MIRRLLPLGVMSAALLAAPAAQASVTLGQTQYNFNCGSAGYTLVQDAIGPDPAYTVPAGGGVLTSWSHQANADGTAVLRLKVYHRTLDPTMFTAVGESAPTPVLTPNTLNTFPTRIPVQGGDILGLSVLLGGAPACVFTTASAGDTIRQGDGDAAVNTVQTFGIGPVSQNRVNASAVLEPDADHDGYGDETQDKCVGTAGTFNGCPSTVAIDKLQQRGAKPKVTVTATVPGAGTLAAGSANDASLASASGKTSLKAVSKIISSTPQQQVTLVLKLTKSAKKKLADKGKLKTQVKVVYTPPGGPSSSQVGKVKLKT